MAVLGFLSFLYRQIFTTLPVPTGSYAGQTVVVTGSNIGLGKEAARHFARLGASTIILAVRNLRKGKDAKAEIEKDTNCGPNVLQVWEVDMASYASVKAFAARITTDLPRIDIFIENAGKATGIYTKAEDNESSITINVISTFLLAALVLPKLKESAEKYGIRPVLTIVASAVHATAKFTERNAPEEKIFDMLSDEAVFEKNKVDRYPVSKLLEVLAVQAIGERYPADSYAVTINCTSPGLCRSGLARELSDDSFHIQRSPIARSTEHGSRALVHAGSQGPESHGKYLSDCVISPTRGLAAGKGSKELRDRVWRELTQKLESIQPGVTRGF
ncbi:related to light induced alcohol dehydrogenase Bli-4 [Cephalotrichum gorgonifer]|uniref:Related to light induced alcohol dehydrogenase Bli-4 n=1 Tax=Cephalotrichum gorgonifer TaxID=2041049 RepID=A0AAE8N481_9PEZI|nr:related to light induced alcohol dehydrogenase Bli-4 [Cephalotrichum gorgonifer]